MTEIAHLRRDWTVDWNHAPAHIGRLIPSCGDLVLDVYDCWDASHIHNHRALERWAKGWRFSLDGISARDAVSKMLLEFVLPVMHELVPEYARRSTSCSLPESPQRNSWTRDSRFRPSQSASTATPCGCSSPTCSTARSTSSTSSSKRSSAAQSPPEPRLERLTTSRCAWSSGVPPMKWATESSVHALGTDVRTGSWLAASRPNPLMFTPSPCAARAESSYT